MKNWLPPVSFQSSAMPDGPAQIRTLVDLVANRVAWSAFAVPARVAVLHDEVGDDAMYGDAVEEPLARQRHEVVHRQRRVGDGQLHLDRAASSRCRPCGEYGGDTIRCHSGSSTAGRRSPAA